MSRPSDPNLASQVPDFNIIDNQDNDFDRVVSKLEILVIKDYKELFAATDPLCAPSFC